MVHNRGASLLRERKHHSQRTVFVRFHRSHTSPQSVYRECQQHSKEGSQADSRKRRDACQSERSTFSRTWRSTAARQLPLEGAEDETTHRNPASRQGENGDSNRFWQAIWSDSLK